MFCNCSFRISPIQNLTFHHFISFELPDTFLTFLILKPLQGYHYSVLCVLLFKSRLRNLFLFYFLFVFNKKSRAYSRRRSQPCREGNRELTSCMKDTLLPGACGTVKRGGEVNEKEGGMERENGLFPFFLFSNSPFAHLPL